MTNTPNDTPDKPRSRWIKPLLFASLAANLLIVGIVAGAFLSDDGPRKRNSDEDRAARGVIGEPFFRALAPEDRRAVARSIIRERDTFRDSRQNLRQRFENFLTALRAQDFDRAMVAGLLAEQRRAAVQRQELGEKLLLDRLEQMTADERAAYADELETRLRWIRKR